MTDTLRDRIAAEVLAECDVSSPAAYRVADAVIEALGLEQEESYMRPGWEGTTFHRYVTEWETDD